MPEKLCTDMATDQETRSVPASATTKDDSQIATVAAPANESAHAADDKNNERTGNDALPSPEACQKVENYQVLDREGNAHPFKSLYQGPDTAQRVLIIFVRHFFCGSCQEFLISLSQAIKPDDLARLPTSTSIVVIGCGDPGLIEFYATHTECPFPMYADPTRKLYDDLGMTNTLALGSKPEYIRKSMLRIIGESIIQGLKQIPSGLATKGGDSRQVGGEFLYEITAAGLQKQVTWCHRMETTRDHTSIDKLVRVLDPGGQYLQRGT
ncbi:hypothetical protein N7532_011476 [Penicillium argentinense]|uniref:AhpC/TSA antioxidant enzyme-domain-containing protein n=1 Tax=Penicillium argentinense TaxID=1131581 RepID=A0A9W9EIH3_9EURO|nr:uncharacterized protein N7532_011476 [Penicillium argentinense]KAJ5082433.1 hypothetical protein N7532_011476 [Penicillium argentinense]